MSRQAIAAVLARGDLAGGDRLAAFSLASFAGREHRAWPGAAAAAQRAGLSGSRYLEARDRLVRRGLVLVEAEASGRGRSSTLLMAFAHAGPWWEGEINVDLVEAVLGSSVATGVARLLLAAMAVLADEDGAVRDFTTEQICAAAGIAVKSYQRANTQLLASGALVLVNGVGGRGNMNVWTVPDPRVRTGRIAHAPRGESFVRRRSASGARRGFDGGIRRRCRGQRDGVRKGWSAPEGFGGKPCDRDRPFGHKGWSGSGALRPSAGGNTGRKPGRKGGQDPAPTRVRGY